MPSPEAQPSYRPHHNRASAGLHEPHKDLAYSKDCIYLNPHSTWRGKPRLGFEYWPGAGRCSPESEQQPSYGAGAIIQGGGRGAGKVWQWSHGPDSAHPCSRGRQVTGRTGTGARGCLPLYPLLLGSAPPVPPAAAVEGYSCKTTLQLDLLLIFHVLQNLNTRDGVLKWK